MKWPNIGLLSWLDVGGPQRPQNLPLLTISCPVQFTRKSASLECCISSAFMVTPYNNISELSYTTTLSYTTDTILPGLG